MSEGATPLPGCGESRGALRSCGALRVVTVSEVGVLGGGGLVRVPSGEVSQCLAHPLIFQPKPVACSHCYRLHSYAETPNIVPAVQSLVNEARAGSARESLLKGLVGGQLGVLCAVLVGGGVSVLFRSGRVRAPTLAASAASTLFSGVGRLRGGGEDGGKHRSTVPPGSERSIAVMVTPPANVRGISQQTRSEWTASLPGAGSPGRL